MCQLCYTNLNDRELNIQFTIAASFLGANKGPHKDGFGFRYGNEVWKSKYSADALIDYGEALRTYIPKKNRTDIMSHIRWGNVGGIEDKNAHPFVGKRLVFAHNGTLKLFDGIIPKGMTDSEYFLELLESELDSNPELVTAIKEVMKKFYGKFAFLIWDTKTKTQYIMRGTTAKLHVLYMIGPDKKSVGYVVDTNKETLEDCAVLVKNMWEAQTGKEINWQFQVKELPENSIYVDNGLNTNLVFVDKLIENKEPPKKKAVVVNKGNNKESVKIDTYHARIIKFMLKHSLHPSDLDVLFQNILGVPLLGVTDQDIKFFCERVIPLLSATKKARKIVKKKDGFDTIALHEYVSKKMPYPWMLLNMEEIRQLITGD